MSNEISLACMAVLMYFPDQYARGVAQNVIVDLVAGKQPDRDLLSRVVKLIEAKGATAQHADVWRAKEQIEAWLEGRLV